MCQIHSQDLAPRVVLRPSSSLYLLPGRVPAARRTAPGFNVRRQMLNGDAPNLCFTLRRGPRSSTRRLLPCSLRRGRGRGAWTSWACVRYDSDIDLNVPSAYKATGAPCTLMVQQLTPRTMDDVSNGIISGCLIKADFLWQLEKAAASKSTDENSMSFSAMASIQKINNEKCWELHRWFSRRSESYMKSSGVQWASSPVEFSMFHQSAS